MTDKIAKNLHRQTEAARDLVSALRSDDSDLITDMIEGETDLFEALDEAIAEIDNCEIIIAGCKAKEEQIADRRKKAERRIETVRSLIEQALVVSGEGTARRPTATLTVKDVPPKPIITEESAIPAQYWKQADPVIDKAAINKAVKDGEAIPGVTLSNGGTSLQIRRV